MPTSPENHPQTQAASRTDIEAVSGDDPAAVERAAPAPDMVGEWRRLWVFLRRPTLAVAGQSAAPFTVLARIYTLDMIAIACLIGLASVAVAAGVYIPETALAGLEFTLPLILAVLEHHRRKGVASAMIAETRRVARECGAWTVFVQADIIPEDEPARALYRKLSHSEITALHFDIEP
jgi:GNAT superfamily N-acetyltransferase